MILVGIVGGIFALFWLAMRWLICLGLRDPEAAEVAAGARTAALALPIMIVGLLLF